MNLKKKPLFLLSAVIIILMLLLPGCITATYETKLNSDGSGERIQDLAIDESFAGMLDSSGAVQGKKSLEEELKASMPKDAKYKKFTKEGKVHHQIIFKFKNIDELNKANKKLNEDSDVPQAKGAKLEKADYLIFATYKFTDEFPGGSKSNLNAEEEQIAKAISINYKLTLPGKITKAKQTDDIEDDTATWQINPIEGGKIEATSRYIRWWLIILLIVLIVIILIVGLILLFMGLKKKKRDAPKHLKTPEPQPEKE